MAKTPASSADAKEAQEPRYLTAEIKEKMLSIFYGDTVQNIMGGSGAMDDDAKELQATSKPSRNKYGSLSKAAWILLADVYPFTKGLEESDEARETRKKSYRVTGKIEYMKSPDWDVELWETEKAYINGLKKVNVACPFCNRMIF